MEEQDNQTAPEAAPETPGAKKGSSKKTIIIIAAIVVVLIIAGLLFWLLGGKNSALNPVNSVKKAAQESTLETQCLAKYHDANLCHFEAWSSLNPIDKMAYTGTMTETANGQTSTIVFKQDGKGNTSMTMSGGGQPGELNTVEYGGSTYMQNGSTWTKYPSSPGTTSAQSSPSSSLSFMDSILNTQFTKVGTEACGNLTCYKYKITENGMGDQYVWFDTKDFKMREFSTPNFGAGGAMDMKISYDPVTISAPSPVQEMTVPSVPTAPTGQ